jgi:hypothetical protein
MELSLAYQGQQLLPLFVFIRESLMATLEPLKTYANLAATS